MWRLTNLIEKVEHNLLKYNENEIRVREITGEHPWAPTGPELQELARISYEFSQIDDLMASIWRRINHPKSTWCNVYKSLLIIDYLIKNGSDLALTDIQNHSYLITTIKSREYIDAQGKDRSKDITHRSNEIIKLLDNDQQLMEERRNAKAFRAQNCQYSSVKSHYAQLNDDVSESSSFQSTTKQMINNFKTTPSYDSKSKPSNNNYPPSFIPPTTFSNHNSHENRPKIRMNDNILSGISKSTTFAERQSLANSKVDKNVIVQPAPEISCKSQPESLIDLISFAEPTKTHQSDVFDMFDPLQQPNNPNYHQPSNECNNKSFFDSQPYNVHNDIQNTSNLYYNQDTRLSTAAGMQYSPNFNSQSSQSSQMYQQPDSNTHYQPMNNQSFFNRPTDSSAIDSNKTMEFSSAIPASTNPATRKQNEFDPFASFADFNNPSSNSKLF